MQKLAYAIAMLVLCAGLIAGCAGVAPAAPAAPDAAAPAAKEGVTLTYMASQGWIKDAELELAKKFESKWIKSR